MAIHVMTYNDPGAPNFTPTTTQHGNHIIDVLHYFLVGNGWEVVHDSSRRTTGTNGKLVLRHPSGEFCVVFENEDAMNYIVGLADDGFADGSLVNYQSGLLSSGGNPHRFFNKSYIFWQRWRAIYDDVSHTLIFGLGSPVNSTLNFYYNDNYNKNRAQVGFFYIGTLATPSAARRTIPAVMVGAIATRYPSDDAANVPFAGIGLPATTLIKADSAPASGDALMVPGSTMIAGSMSLGPAADLYTPLLPATVAITTGANPATTTQASDVGALRGCFRIGNYGLNQVGAWWARHQPDVNPAEDGSRFTAYREEGDGGQRFYHFDNATTGFGLVSTDPSDWEDLP